MAGGDKNTQDKFVTKINELGLDDPMQALTNALKTLGDGGLVVVALVAVATETTVYPVTYARLPNTLTEEEKKMIVKNTMASLSLHLEDVIKSSATTPPPVETPPSTA